MKMGKNPPDPGSRIPGSWQHLGHFSRNLDEVKNRTESDVKDGYKSNKLQKKKLCNSLISVDIWIQGKGWFGSWHMSGHSSTTKDHRNLPLTDTVYDSNLAMKSVRKVSNARNQTSAVKTVACRELPGGAPSSPGTGEG